MPTISLHPFSTTEFSMQYKEPYVSAGVNKRNAAVIPPGIHRGFGLVAHGAIANTIVIKADPVNNDHLAEHLNVDGYSISVHKTGGDFNITIVDPGVDTLYVVALLVNYTTAATTTCDIKAYTLTPVDEFTGTPNLLVLGTVLVPGGVTALIPSANVTHNRRNSAWEVLSTEAIQWTPMLRNGGFELSKVVTSTEIYATAAYWKCSAFAPSFYWTADTTHQNSGNRCLALVGDNTVNLVSIEQFISYPVSAGKKVKVKLWKKVLVPVTAGSLNLIVDFYNGAGATTSVTTPIPASGVDAVYTAVEVEYVVPAGTTILGKVTVIDALATFGAAVGTVPLLYLDDVQVWVENQDKMAPGSLERFRQPVSTQQFFLEDMVTTQYLDAVMMEYSGGNLNISNRASGGITTKLSGPLNLLSGFDSGGTVARISTPDTAGIMVLISETTHSGGQPTTRIYSNSDGTFLFMYNARYDHTTFKWNKDVNGVMASKQWQGATGINWQFHEATHNTAWLDGAWDMTPLGISAVTVGDPYTSTDKIMFSKVFPTKANPVNTDPILNTLVAKNVVKAWANIDSYNGGGVPVVTSGFNVLSATRESGGLVLRINFAQAIASPEYCCIAICRESSLVGGFQTSCSFVADTSNIGHIDIRGVTAIAGSATQVTDFSAGAGPMPKVHIIVMGEQ